MGRPNQAPLPPRPPTRRSFFTRSAGAALATAAVSLAPSLVPLARAAGPRFQHGVASGDPLADRVILWTRVTPAEPASSALQSVDWLVAADPALTQVVASGRTRTGAWRDHTVKVDVAGLAPATTYYYRFASGGESSPVGRTRTLPAGPAGHLRVAVMSCSNHAAGHFNAYRRIAERADLDLLLHLGDYLYEYGSGQFGNVRPTLPPTEILTLGDYRQRHAQYKSDPDLQELHRQHPMVAIWDDHEIANDAWQRGAQNHDPATEGLWAGRVARGLKAYDEWMPVRQLAEPRQNQRSLRFGDLAEVVLLEERFGARSKQLPAPIPVPGLGQGFIAAGRYLDPARSMLGAAQEAWLADTLQQSTARWKLIGQGVMVAQLKALGRTNADGGSLFVNPDQWDGYPPARDRLFDVFAGAMAPPPVDNVVVLTGDIHSAWAADLTRDPNNPDPAAGGYDPATGAGSLAVEFVTTSITSPGIDDPDGSLARLAANQNPHFRHIDLNQRGYLLLDVTPERVVGEFWAVDTVAVTSNVQTFTAAWEVQHGTRRLVASAMTNPRPNPPAPAP